MSKLKMQLTLVIVSLLAILVFAIVNQKLFNFKADESTSPTTKILLPVDNERFTYLNNPLIQGKASPGSMLKIYDNDAFLADVQTDSSGNFYYKSIGFSNGNHKITVKKSDDLSSKSEIYIAINTSDPSKAILKAKNTQILENGHPFYANGANQYDAIEKYMGNPVQVETDFANAEKAGIKMLRVINYTLDDMALPNPDTAPVVSVVDGGGMLAGSYIYRYTCANLSKDSFAYNTAETLPSPITVTVNVTSGQKVSLALKPCAQSYRYLVYRRNATDLVGSEKYLGFAEGPAGQNATFIDDGAYLPANIWPNPTNPPVLSAQARNSQAKTTLEAGDYVYRYIYKQQRKPADGRNDKFVTAYNGQGLTLASPTAQIHVDGTQAVKITIPSSGEPWSVLYRRKASDPVDSEKALSVVRNTNGIISYIDEGIAAATTAIPTANTTTSIALSATNNTHSNPRSTWPTNQSHAYMTGFGNWNEDAMVAADHVMALAQKYNIRILFTFLDQHDNNTGGVREIARNCGTWNSNFFADTCSKNITKQIIDKFTNRTNTVTGKLYKDDPAIYAWELINEPWETNGGGGFRTWIREVGFYLKSIDSNHMLSSGDDGSIWYTHNYEAGYNMNNNHDFVLDGVPEPIDLLTWHGYPESSGFVFNHGYYGEFNPTDPDKRGGMSDAEAASWLEKYGPVSGPISTDQAVKQLQLHSHYAYLLNKPVIFGEWGLDWTKPAGKDWISSISNAILTSSPDIERLQNVIPTNYNVNPLTDFWNINQSAAALSLDNNVKYNNNSSIKIEATSYLDSAGHQQNRNGVISKKLVIKPNTKYWFEFTAKNPSSKTLAIKIHSYYVNGVQKFFSYGYSGEIITYPYNDGWKTTTRFNSGLCELTTPDGATEIDLALNLVNGQAGDYAYIGDIKLYELGAKENSSTTTFAGTGWWALPDATGLGNAANTEALKAAAVNFARKSMEDLPQLSSTVTDIPNTTIPPSTPPATPIVNPAPVPPAPAPLPPLSQRVKLTGFSYKSYSVSNDSITIRNTGTININTSGWRLKTNKNQTYTLPNYNLSPNSSLTIHAGKAPKLRCKRKLIRYKDSHGRRRYKFQKVCPTRPPGHIYMSKSKKFFDRKHGSFTLTTSSGEVILSKRW